LEATAFLKESKPDPDTWEACQKAILKALAAYPEAAWQVIATIQADAMAALPEERKIPFLLEFHKSIAAQEGPVMWDLESALNTQATSLGSDVSKQLEFFEKVLAEQAGSKSWFAPVIAWGQSKFGKDASTSAAFFASLSRVFSSDAAGANQDGLRSALRPAVIAAAANNNVFHLQAIHAYGRRLQ
jgi:hypothetical protein